MKTALDDQLLMANIELPINKKDYLELLNQKGIKPRIKQVINKEYISFSHKINTIEKSGYSLEGPFQNMKYVEISLRFDNEDNLKSQTISLDHRFNGISTGIGFIYEILEPFLDSDDWKILRKDEDNPNSKIESFKHRIGKYLLENKSNGTLLIYSEGNYLKFVDSKFRESYLNDKVFWNYWD